VRPLDFLGSLKLKLGVVIVAAVAVTVAAVWIGDRVGLSFLLGGIAGAALALAMVQFLAHGMTFPLREMVTAAQAMARGDYSRRVTATSRDEVGDLARAFNSMAGELEEVDRLRRDLVANASHELRTPIGALQARLENFVDGVERVFCLDATTGAAQGSAYYVSAVTGSRYQDFRSFPDGSAAYAARGSSGTKIKIVRILPCP